MSSKIVIKNCHQNLSSKFVIKNCHQYLKGLWGRSLMSKIKRWLSQSVSDSVSEWQGHLLSCQVIYFQDSESIQSHFFLLLHLFRFLATKCEVRVKPFQLQDAPHQPWGAEPALRHLLSCLGGWRSSHLDYHFLGGQSDCQAWDRARPAYWCPTWCASSSHEQCLSTSSPSIWSCSSSLPPRTCCQG